MKRVATGALLVVLLIIPVAGLNPEQISTASVTFNANHSFSYTTSPGYAFESLNANLSWVPMQAATQTRDVDVTNGEFLASADKVTVERSDASDFTTEITAEVSSQRQEPRITEETPFPFNDIDQSQVRSQSAYLQSTDLIKVTPEIRRVTTDIVADESTLRSVVDSVAEWTSTNIKYNLSTTNAEASLPSDQVLEQRNGVCDEITNLFIAQLRSLGIPARYVSGVAYTESDLFDDRWGAHGWTEVYFPDHGWVPYDPTYKQFGYVDATHIAFNKGVGAEKYGSSYQWRAQGVDVSYDRSWTADLNEYENMSRRTVSADVDVAADTVGFDGSNVVTATVRSGADWYQTVGVRALRTEKLRFPRSRTKTVTLSPGGSETVTWDVKAAGPFRDGFEYEMPVRVRVDGQRVGTSFDVRRGGTSTTTDGSSRRAQASCEADQTRYEPGESVMITCDIPGSSQACAGGRCGEPARNPSVEVTAPTVSEAIPVELPGVGDGETVYVSVPVATEPSVAEASGRYDAGNETLSFSYVLRRGHAASDVRVVVNDGDVVVNESVSPAVSTVSAEVVPGWDASVNASVVVDGRRVPVDVDVRDRRGPVGRVVDWGRRTIMSLNPFS